jgi:hypothetical protein
MTDEQLLSRAMAAHYKASAREGAIYDQPSAASSGIEEIDGKRYVVLRNINGILRVYRVRPSDGVLRALRRWPKELENER